MHLVIDSSFALAWALPDESSTRADRFLGRLGEDDLLWVPALWWYEVANALMMAQRRRRISETDRLALIQLYEGLPIQADVQVTAHTIRQIQSLALSYRLSAYDAAYLELAMRKSLALATMDKALLQAARAAGVETTS
ncbi:MAG: type II toxin-antitoxin system VapC family toxin [Nitrospira sp.]|nr:type II toxin-antitoxin system VapC family toxin [Nitrospira sp.]